LEDIIKLQGFLTFCLFGNSFFFLSPAFSENDIGETGKKIPRMSQNETTITREKIENSTANSVMELVKERTPGVFATQNNVVGFGFGMPGTGQLSIRGLGSSPNTQVLFNYAI